MTAWKPGGTVWHVEVAEHTVGGRYEIPATSLRVYAPDARAARVKATRQVHAVAGTPPWKPLLRATYLHTQATLVSSGDG
jgi:hypothetical protein